MNSAEDRAWAEANLPVLGRFGKEWKRPVEEGLSLERQQIIMREGNSNARLWLALQGWADEGLRVKFVTEEDRNVVLAWWEYQQARDINWAFDRDVVMEALAEKGIDLSTIATRAVTERAQLNIWGYVKKHSRGNDALRMTGHTLASSAHLGPTVRKVMIKFIEETIAKGIEHGVIEVLGDENFGIGGLMAGYKVVQLRVNKTRKAEKETISKLELVKDTVDGLAGNNCLSAEELSQVIKPCLPHGTWFVYELLNRKINVLNKVEADIIDKIWVRVTELCRAGRKNYPHVWPEEYEEYGMDIRKMLSIMSRTTNYDWLNRCLAEGVEFFPGEVVRTIMHWPDEVLRNVNPKVLAGALKSDNKDVRECAIAIAGKVGGLTGKRKPVGI